MASNSLDARPVYAEMEANAMNSPHVLPGLTVPSPGLLMAVLLFFEKGARGWSTPRLCQHPDNRQDDDGDRDGG